MEYCDSGSDPNHPLLSGSDEAHPAIDCPTASKEETPEGHIYDLATRLSEESSAEAQAEARRFAEGKEAPHTPFPDSLFRLPIPNEIFREMPELSGSAVRLTLLVIRAFFRFDPERGEWSVSARHLKASEIASVPEQGPGMSKKSILEAAPELESHGWIKIQEGSPGKAHHFRCLLDAPGKGFTWLPTALFEIQGRLPSSALQALLCIYRETWGWTRHEQRKGGKTVVHRVRAPLSNDDLARQTGLHSSTVRSAVQDLQEIGLIERDRPHAASPFFYRATETKYTPHREKSRPPSSGVEKCVHRQAYTHERTNSQSDSGSDSRPPVAAPTEDECEETVDHRRRHSERKSSPPSRADTSDLPPDDFSDEQRDLFKLLTGTGIDLAPDFATKMVRRRAPSLIRKTFAEFRERDRAGKIKNPGGWMRKALEELWFAPKTREDPSQRRRSTPTSPSSPEPAGKSIETFEQIATDDGEGVGRSPDSISGDSAPIQDPVGLTHDEMCHLIDALNPPTVDWKCIQRDNAPNLFVPPEKVVNHFRRWADKVSDDSKLLIKKAICAGESVDHKATARVGEPA